MSSDALVAAFARRFDVLKAQGVPDDEIEADPEAAAILDQLKTLGPHEIWRAMARVVGVL